MNKEAEDPGRGWMAVESFLTASELIQLIASGRKTGELEVSNGQCSGKLSFRDGQVQEAVCWASGKRGIHGAVCLLCMRGASTRFRPVEVRESPDGSMATMGVLLEAARRMDEGERPCANDSGDGIRAGVSGIGGHGSTPARRSGRCLMYEVEGEQRLAPLDRPMMRVGRDDACEILMPSPSVSRRHADVHAIGPMLILRDVGSRNGTFVNGSKIRQARVERGDEIVFGDVQAFVVIPEEFEAYRDTEPVLRAAEQRRPRKDLSQTTTMQVPGKS